MNLELSITLQDTEENCNKFYDFPLHLKMNIGDLEYDLQLLHIEKSIDNRYEGLGDYGYRFGPRTLKVMAHGLNSKQKELDEAVALVNKTKKDYKEAQRKLSELNGPKSQ